MAIISFTRNIESQYRRYYMSVAPIMADPLVRGTFGLVASLVFIAILVFFALSPTVNTIIALRQKVAEQEKLLADMDTKIQSLIVAQQQYSAVERDISLLLRALPDKPMPQTVIKGLVDSGSDGKVTISRLQVQGIPLESSAENKGLSTVKFSLSLSGNEDQAYSFLSAMENRLRYIRAINIVSQYNTTTPPGFTIDLNGVGYFYETQQ